MFGLLYSGGSASELMLPEIVIITLKRSMLRKYPKVARGYFCEKKI
ncbi:MAG: hypothetical protein ACTSXJ_08110 [Candidatus Baldrarchaeia archaeon]